MTDMAKWLRRRVVAAAAVDLELSVNSSSLSRRLEFAAERVRKEEAEAALKRRLVALRQENLSFSDIAERLGLARRTVAKYVKQLGLQQDAPPKK